MIPLYNLNNLELKNIPSHHPNQGNSGNFIFTTLALLAAIGLGLYFHNKKAITTKYENL
jgi:hypothetical protein